MEHTPFEQSGSCVADFDLSVPSYDHTGTPQDSSADDWPSNKIHRSLNAMTRSEKIVMPPVIANKLGHKKENSSPTSVMDWDVNDHVGAVEPHTKKKHEVDSLELIFSPRRQLPPLRKTKMWPSSELKCRSSSPTDFLGTRCGCSIMKEKYNTRLKQERLFSRSPHTTSSL